MFSNLYGRLIFEFSEFSELYTHIACSQRHLTCAGVPSLDQAPDDGATFVTGLLHTFALLFGEAVLQHDPQVGLVLLRVLKRDKTKWENFQY